MIGVVGDRRRRRSLALEDIEASPLLLDLASRPKYPLKKYPDKGYLPTVPKDAYDNFLVYRIPGTGGEPFDVISYGADGVEGGTDENEDVWNHDKRPAKKEEPKKDEKK